MWKRLEPGHNTLPERKQENAFTERCGFRRFSDRPRRIVLILASLLLLAAGLLAAEPAHPSLLFSADDIPALRAKVESGWHARAMGAMRERADRFLEVPTDPYPTAMRRTNGKATAGRALNNRLSTLALTGMLAGERRYIDKAVEMLAAAAGQWSMADMEKFNGHLGVGDSAHAFAMAYDWLHSYMSDAQRAAVRKDLEALGAWLYRYSESGEYYARYQPTPLSCNHNVVVHGGLGLAALALGDRPEWRDQAARFVEGYFLHARDDTGYNYEGIGYYAYGSWAAIPFAVALHRAGGRDLVGAVAKNRLVPRYVLHQILPWGEEVVAMNDSPPRLGSSGGLMHLIARYRDRAALWGWLRLYGEEGDGTYGTEPGTYLGNAASIPYVLVFADPHLEPLAPEKAGVPTHRVFAGGRAAFRSGWDDLDALATFTSGFDQHRGHNHRDENSFTWFARGEQFAIDPGYQPWDTRSHNTVLVDGRGQNRDEEEYDAGGKTVRNEDLGGAWSITGDATDAFPEDAQVARALRHLLFVGGERPYLVIVDDIEKRGGAKAEFAWLLHTDRKNEIEVDSSAKAATIRGARRGALCRVQFLWPPEGLAIAETDLGGETFKARGREYPRARFYRELRATVRAPNPRFVAVISSADEPEALREAAWEGSEADRRLVVRGPNGAHATIRLRNGRFEFRRQRQAPGAGVSW